MRRQRPPALRDPCMVQALEANGHLDGARIALVDQPDPMILVGQSAGQVHLAFSEAVGDGLDALPFEALLLLPLFQIVLLFLSLMRFGNFDLLPRLLTPQARTLFPLLTLLVRFGYLHPATPPLLLLAQTLLDRKSTR